MANKLWTPSLSHEYIHIMLLYLYNLLAVERDLNIRSSSKFKHPFIIRYVVVSRQCREMRVHTYELILRSAIVYQTFCEMPIICPPFGPNLDNPIQPNVAHLPTPYDPFDFNFR